MTISALQSKLNSALVTNAAGDYALRTMAEGAQTIGALTLTDDANAGGNYLLNDQTTTNMMSKGTVYRFDGVDDVINVDALAVHLTNVNNTKGSINWAGKIKDLTTDNDMIWGFGDTSADEYIILKVDPTDYKLTAQCRLETGGLQWSFTGDNTYSEDVEYDIRIVQNGTSPVMYVNGILQNITFAVSTDLTAWFHTTTGIDNGRIGCLNYDGSGNVFFGKCEVNRFGYDNFAPTAAEVKDLISGNIPFKWQYGNQTELVTNGAFASDVASWSADGTSPPTITWNAGEYADIASILLNNDRISQAITTVIGKTYRMTMVVTNFSAGTSVVNMRLGASDNIVPITADGIYELEYVAIATATNAYPAFTTSSGTETTYSIDDVSVVALGAVALYDQTSISETKWYNKSSNSGLDGAVTGASVLNPPSVTPLACLRSARIKIEPGTTPGTNIKLTDVSTVNNSFNSPALIDAVAIVKGDTPASTSTSFGLSAGGTGIKIDLGYTPAGVLPHAIIIHDMNSSTATEIYFVDVAISSGLLELTPRISGSVTAIDWTTIMDLGDRMDILLSFITATG